jgi:hypothetical protein
MVNMNVLLFGATGMIGQGVLRECLTPRCGESRPSGEPRPVCVHPKLREVVHTDLL